MQLGIFQEPGSSDVAIGNIPDAGQWGIAVAIGNIPGAGQRGIAVAIGQMVNMPWGGVQWRLAEFAP